MSTGIPGLNPPLPPMDPMYVDRIAFNFGQVSMEFNDLNIEGLKEYRLESSRVNKAAREWKITMFIPPAGGARYIYADWRAWYRPWGVQGTRNI